MAATVAEAIGALDDLDAVETVEAVEAVEAVEDRNLDIATKVSALIAKLTAILQMHSESGEALRREETTMSTSAFCVGFQETSKSITSLTKV